MQIPSFVGSGTMVIELREFNDKKKKKKNTMDKMQKLNFVIMWPKCGSLIFGTQITFDMFCAVKSLQVNRKQEVNFQMYGENTKTIAIPIFRVLQYPVIL